ncbi:MAG: hypothetical protein E6R04_00955 [Spirochaetes bacterium]|nr:MAG: hypothetical protein E6R04_00955 [Spirochaetota bacterium]
MTPYDVVLEEAAKVGVRGLEEDEIENIIWSHTGFPCFWPNKEKTPEENFRTQLKEFFEERKKA